MERYMITRAVLRILKIEGLHSSAIRLAEYRRITFEFCGIFVSMADLH